MSHCLLGLVFSYTQLGTVNGVIGSGFAYVIPKAEECITHPRLQIHTAHSYTTEPPSNVHRQSSERALEHGRACGLREPSLTCRGTQRPDAGVGNAGRAFGSASTAE